MSTGYAFICIALAIASAVTGILIGHWLGRRDRLPAPPPPYRAPEGYPYQGEAGAWWVENPAAWLEAGAPERLADTGELAALHRPPLPPVAPLRPELQYALARDRAAMARPTVPAAAR